MEEKPMDRRVRKTKRQLRLALMQLMSEKSVKDISVRELAAIADINRGTFYIHYKDVYDLLTHLEDEVAELGEQIDAVDEDLADVEEIVFDDYDDECDCCGDDDEMYEVECPACHETIYLDESILEDGAIECPNCGTELEFDFDCDCDDCAGSDGEDD